MDLIAEIDSIAGVHRTPVIDLTLGVHQKAVIDHLDPNWIQDLHLRPSARHRFGSSRFAIQLPAGQALTMLTVTLSSHHREHSPKPF